MNLRLNKQNQTWYREQGRKAQRAYKNIEKHEASARRNWIALGEIAAEVKDSAPPRSGILDRWRAEYLDGKITKNEISDCIWCYNNQKALRLVRETISNPQSMRREFRQVAKEAARDFISAGRNDIGALAKELGITTHEAQTFIDAAHRDAETARRRAAERQQEEQEQRVQDAIEGRSGHMRDDPIPFGDTPDVLTGVKAMRQALVQLDDLDIKGAREKLARAIEGKS